MIRSCALLVGLCCASVLAIPPTPVADPSGINKSRYLSMSMPSNGGEPMALRVTMVSLHHVVPPYGSGPSIPFTSFEGEIRWVGPPVFATESDNDPTPFVAAPLQCAPYYHDWSTLGLFHVYGDAVVPNSSYDVAAMDESCMGTEEACSDVSSSLTIATARYGDVIAPFSPPSPAAQPDFDDFAAVVAKVNRTSDSKSKAIMQLHAQIPDPTRTVNVWDCIMCGNAHPGVPYPYEPIECESPRGSGMTDSAFVARGNPTPRVFITPVPAQGTASYPLGTQIVGQELIASAGGFRAFLNVQIQDFNPGNTPPILRGCQIQVDAEGLLGVNANPPASGADLSIAQEACPGAAGTTHCRTAFGEAGTRCNVNQCTGAFVSTFPFGGFPAHEDWVFHLTEEFALASQVSPTGPIVGGGFIRPASGDPIDDGQRKYVGTIVIDVPLEATGHTYSLNVRIGDETLLVYGHASIDEIPVGETSPAILSIGMQSVGIDYNRPRFISFVPGHSGEQMAIRVKLVSLHHPCLPFTSCNVNYLPFTSFEGQYRWVGAPTQHVESTASGVPFHAATLQCDPHYQDWSSSGYLHVTGSAVVPSSIYEVQFVPASCMGNEDQCAEISAPFTLKTAAWGDVEAPFNPPAASVQPDLADVSALINKFRSAPGAPIKARALLAGSDVHGNIEIDGDLSFIHICACIDAFRGSSYSSVHVGPEACP